MRVVSGKKLKDFWTKHRDAEGPLRAWLRVVEQLEWERFADVRATYSHADKVGRCTVFNIGGNKYRLVTRIDFDASAVYVRHVLTHAEYDRGTWKGAC